MRQIDASGVINTIAGNGSQGYTGDNGPAVNATFHDPAGLAIDASGNLYIADEDNNAIRKVAGGIITTLAGNGNYGYSGDNGPATSAKLGFPPAVAVDGAGNLYIADQFNQRIRLVNAAGTISTFAGSGAQNFLGDGGAATSATLNEPQGVALGASGSLLIADTGNSRVRQVAGGTINTVAGDGGFRFSGDGGPAVDAALSGAQGVAVDGSGNLFIADGGNNRIREVSSAGIISTVAGNGTSLPGDPGGNGSPATSANLSSPGDVTLDTLGDFFIADTNDHVIRQVNPAGLISTVAGDGIYGYSGDHGPATNASLSTPLGIAVDASGNLFIADAPNCVVREVSNGTISTVAGNGTCGYLGDNGPAIAAELRNPQGVAVDGAGNLYIADSSNSAVRKVSAGAITTIAGNGTCGYSGDGGPGNAAALCFPWGVALDAGGDLFIGDWGNNVVRELEAGGAIATVAGSGVAGFSGDNGPATLASLSMPGGVAIDAACNLYIADTGNSRIRKVAGLTVTPGVIYLDATAQAGPPVSVTALGSCSWAATPGASWIAVNPGGGGTVTFSVQANTTGTPRTGPIDIGSQAVSITQRETAEIFADVAPSDYFFDFADVMYSDNITAGCSTTPLDYCPDATTTRAEMAVFLIEAIEGSYNFTYTTSPYFTDVPASSPFFKFVQKLKDLGITSGCSTTLFCPDDPVTRGEMAVFVIQSRYGTVPFTYPSTPYFSDVPASSPYFPFVQKLAQAGITGGCGGGLYCPNDSLTRGQMAVFVVTGLLNQLLPAATPYLAAAAPNTASPGQAATVTVTGVNTHFAQATTQVAAAAGITPSSIAVTSATSLTVTLTVSSTVALGPSSLVVTTGSEEAVLPNGFTVQ